MEKNYLRINDATVLKRHCVVIPEHDKVINPDNDVVINATLNLMRVGAIFAPEVIDELETVDSLHADIFAKMIVAIISEEKGLDYVYRPLNPDYFHDVDTTSLSKTIRGYAASTSLGMPSLDITEKQYDILTLGSYKDYENIIKNIMSAKVPFSPTDKDILEQYFMTDDNAPNIFSIVTDIPVKENLCTIIDFADQIHIPQTETAKLFKTATDVLRYVVFKMSGEAQITNSVRFKKLTRKERKFILAILERVSKTSHLEEDMLANKELWIRLGEVVHPGEYAKQYPKTYASFNKLRNKIHIDTYNSKLEAALLAKDTNTAVKLLTARPGVFARNLDRVLRDTSDPKSVIDAFRSVASKVPSPLLLSVREHFRFRDVITTRTFMPKCGTAFSTKANYLPIDKKYCTLIEKACDNALIEIFSKRESLGNVYISPEMKQYTVPTAQRNAAKTLKTISRGSAFPIREGTKVLRPFICWMNGEDRTDIDLSVVFLDSDFEHINTVAYYSPGNVRSGCVHSGDITDAPAGASEFVDVWLDNPKSRARYAAVTIASYTQQPFCDLPICCGGWMERKDLSSGEVYEPLTVTNRFDVSGIQRNNLPFIIDLKERRVIWCDIGFANENFERRVNNAATCRTGIIATVQGILENHYPTLYDLYMLNVQARGILVDTPEEADTILSDAENATVKPTDMDIIMAEYL